MTSEVIHKVSEQRSRNMSAIKSKNTKPEIKVRKVLHSMGYRFRLHSKDLPGSPDIVCLMSSFGFDASSEINIFNKKVDP